MPRAKKTLSGTTGQKVEPIKGQTYGEGVRQKELQQAMPAPNAQSQNVLAPTAPQSQPTPQPQAQTDVPAQPVAQAQPMDINVLRERLAGVGGQLTRPDDQPNVPFNKNLDNPMASPGKPFVNRTGQIMRDLSARTGDPLFAELAARARL